MSQESFIDFMDSAGLRQKHMNAFTQFFVAFHYFACSIYEHMFRNRLQIKDNLFIIKKEQRKRKGYDFGIGESQWEVR